MSRWLPGRLSPIKTLSLDTLTLTPKICSWFKGRSDRGGPDVRLSDRQPRPDWLFPQADLDHLFPHWQPTFVDYLFLSYTTATAFSPTDVLPISTRAKLMLMA